ncbi:VQ motif [Musa troglodytarum]|uniref:VQ motif n=1 Tax=Musa troglodytarum TaxID=320322 RepID=A0A9E7FVZ5_9LILI|nr:VQ motif [Musa troglodytarum]URE03367.1 VQ motif [Musa troglodytarum]URE03368.1 VQ motif [Musa troglodytarum]URE03369.1 VQ motif [Musa troglodytarum]URE03370.1 VQ motif [Musa troglodytarum]
MDRRGNNHHHEQQRQQHLGVNKLSKNIRKTPPHHPTYYYSDQKPPQQPQPQVYNISSKDFRSIVQQLTGTPSRDSSPVPNPHPLPRPPSTRLQKIRPPPLAAIARPPPPSLTAAARLPPTCHPPIPYQNPSFNLPPAPVAHPNWDPSSFSRPFISAGFAGPAWAESPVSTYMRYLESSLVSSDTSRQPHPPPLSSPGLLPPLPLPSPRTTATLSPPPTTPSASALPSPSTFLNMLSPKSPYPLRSPGFEYPPPLTPNFALSPLGQSEMWGAGPGPGPRPPTSPGLWFPPSPSGFLPILSPGWRDML